jgi:23S rRNA (cytosine1962-C5)-methyltransferase
VPYYRLVHSESDFLPGLLIDRFAGYFVVQVGTAGMDRLQPLWVEAIEQLFSPSSLILRNDIAVREREGLTQSVDVLHGTVPELVEVHEQGCIYLADLLRGQKTGWFYDQRDNRGMMADLAVGKTMVDVFSHSGGFGLRAAKAGAAHVTLVDSSKLALDLASQAARLNGVDRQLSYEQGDAFAVMERLAAQGKRYDVVIADPPAFVKHKRDMAAGMKGYEKVARLAAALVAPGGQLFVASCSHHAQRNKFNQAVKKGAKDAGFMGRTLKQTGAAPDHPLHPLLLQNEYLKGILLG